MASIIDIINSLPLEDIEAALANPTSLEADSAVIKDIISVACPLISGTIINILVTLFVQWVYASGGGTIVPDPLPQTDAITTVSRGGRNW